MCLLCQDKCRQASENVRGNNVMIISYRAFDCPVVLNYNLKQDLYHFIEVQLRDDPITYSDSCHTKS
ncbi:hypothetical protein MNBD_GAMMA11-900 [hydrothermal vent metagenome]|uniref:Uncharacterized protein n=1 Tax=hydrothermal vent metagenome TaxID=652676 RepID=A0A3B0XQL7_9ZZZZ